ncbi:unnamed protein product, partial [Polarella glacialis]
MFVLGECTALLQGSIAAARGPWKLPTEAFVGWTACVGGTEAPLLCTLGVKANWPACDPALPPCKSGGPLRLLHFPDRKLMVAFGRFTWNPSLVGRGRLSTDAAATFSWTTWAPALRNLQALPRCQLAQPTPSLGPSAPDGGVRSDEGAGREHRAPTLLPSEAELEEREQETQLPEGRRVLPPKLSLLVRRQNAVLPPVGQAVGAQALDLAWEAAARRAAPLLFPKARSERQMNRPRVILPLRALSRVSLPSPRDERAEELARLESALQPDEDEEEGAQLDLPDSTCASPISLRSSYRSRGALLLPTSRIRIMSDFSDCQEDDGQLEDSSTERARSAFRRCCLKGEEVIGRRALPWALRFAGHLCVREDWIGEILEQAFPFANISLQDFTAFSQAYASRCRGFVGECFGQQAAAALQSRRASTCSASAQLAPRSLVGEAAEAAENDEIEEVQKQQPMNCNNNEPMTASAMCIQTEEEQDEDYTMPVTEQESEKRESAALSLEDLTNAAAQDDTNLYDDAFDQEEEENRTEVDDLEDQQPAGEATVTLELLLKALGLEPFAWVFRELLSEAQGIRAQSASHAE